MAYLRKALMAALPGGRLPNGQEQLDQAVKELWDELASPNASMLSRAALYRHLVSRSEVCDRGCACSMGATWSFLGAFACF